ncbi:hypothetical protein ACEPAH_6152 [Sanghuangporus vaninii]
MMHDLLDLALLREVADSNAREGAIDLEPLDEDGLRDEAEGGDLFEDAVVRGLVEDDVVLGLVLDFALGPFLLGFGFSSAGGCGGFCFGLEGRVLLAVCKGTSDGGASHPSQRRLETPKDDILNYPKHGRSTPEDVRRRFTHHVRRRWPLDSLSLSLDAKETA